MKRRRTPSATAGSCRSRRRRTCSFPLLKDNGFGFIPPEHVHNSDYAKYGEFCKSLLLKQLEIDILIDDFPGYVQWDSKLGKAPIRLLVQPDPFRPYWAESWVTHDGSDFGRRVAPARLDDQCPAL